MVSIFSLCVLLVWIYETSPLRIRACGVGLFVVLFGNPFMLLQFVGVVHIVFFHIFNLHPEVLK